MWKALYTREKKNGVKFHFGVSGNPILIKKNRENNNFYLPYDAYHFVKIQDIEKHVEKREKISFQQRYGYVVLSQFNKIRNTLFQLNYHKKEVKEMAEFPENINDFWDDVKGSYNYVVERRREYLNWRYCSKNGGNYKVEPRTTSDKHKENVQDNE